MRFFPNDIPRAVLAGLFILTLLRLVLGAAHELSPAEARLWAEGRHLAAGYWDHGPLVPLLARIGTAIFGQNSFGLRVWMPFFSLGLSLLIFRLVNSLFGDKTAVWTVVVLNFTPLFNAGGVLLLPGAVSLFFWTLALLMIWRAVHRADPRTRYWPLAGAAMGAAWLASPAGILAPLGLVVLLTGSRRWRRRRTQRGPWLALGVCLLMALPMFLWEIHHDWLPRRHHWQSLSHAPRVGEFFAWLGQLTGAASPLVFLGLLWALWHSVLRWRRQAHGDDGGTFLLAFTVPSLVLGAGLALLGEGGLDWTAPALLGCGLLLARHWLETDWTPATLRLALKAGLALAAGYSVVLLQPDLLRHAGLTWSYQLDPAGKLRGWKQAATECAPVITATAAGPDGEPFLIADSQSLAAVLEFYLAPDLPVFQPDGKHPRVFAPARVIAQDETAFWPRYDAAGSPYLGRTALYITDDDRGRPPHAEVRDGFDSVKPVAMFDLMRAGQPVRRLTIFACAGWHGRPL